MNKAKTRDEINRSDKWQIEKVYNNTDEFNKDLIQFEKELAKLIEFEKDFLKDSTSFKNFFLQDEKTSRILEKLAIYANCKSDEDKGNSLYQELSGKITNMYAKYNENTASVIPKILKTDEKIINQYIETEKDLAPYRHFFDQILSRKEHILKEEEESILSAYSPVLSGNSETASYLTNADIQFGEITNENNEKIELTEANYPNFIKSNNRNIRKEVFKRLQNTYGSFKNTLSSTYAQTVNYDSTSARLRKYKSSIEMYLEPKKIPVKLYENLIKTVKNNLSVLYEYYAFKKEVLDLDEFHLYDGYVKIIQDNNKVYDFNEAQDLVINALSILGDEYLAILKKAFTDGWIDKYPNKGKRTGAYSTGSYDTLPYLLLNYTNTYNDVSTLAHELGHSMHSYYTNTYNPYITATYPIFLAEIASTTNELLLSNYMYEHSTNKNEKLNILNEKLDLFKATIYRQTMFAEFEKNIHDYVDKKGILTADYLCEEYYKLNKEYFGSNVSVDEEIKYEWLRIPHFYTPFYVYQYATSLSISCYVAENIINNTPGFKEKYLEFLKSGGKNYPLEILKIIDIDLADTKIFESAINLFKETLEKFKKVYNEK